MPRVRATEANRRPAAEVGFVEPMYALAVKNLPEGKEWFYEVKFDGYRCLAGKRSDGVTFGHGEKISSPTNSRTLPAPANGSQAIRFSMAKSWPLMKTAGSRSIYFSITVHKQRHCSFTPSTFSSAGETAQ
jgi:hypothetical protein